ncbi:tetratricopeptide repeat protein [Psychroserpens sp. XS_ASV72]|uniref:tetratricopeptide repeat protein n=1 Tax=Psychroserpens sp. XS_ASV72 TaxID=3241293 RepID=UPI0035178A26
MKTLKSLLFIIVFSISMTSVAQNMQVGFNYLETGQYAKAETFFNEILAEYPNQKTATLCYGRAVGLNGNPEKALGIFTDLLKSYPSDFEVKLNYGEALLWNKNFEAAQTYYNALVTEEPKSFPALLGYANTLSNLKQYELALTYVNKALEVSPGNANALTSKKYIYLGYAYQKQQQQNYDQAESLLQTMLDHFPNDKDGLMNLANLYIIMDNIGNAKHVYETLQTATEFETEALVGLALVAHLNSKEQRALTFSKLALDKSTEKNRQIATERYIQALIWNQKYKAATKLIDELATLFPNENWVLSLRATLSIYKSDFKDGLENYDAILKNDSTSFDGNLGKANSLKAIGRYNEAYQAAEKTLTIYNNQKDALQFIANLDTQFTPSMETKSAYSFDNGDNEAFTVGTTLNVPLSTQLELLGSYSFRRTSNKSTNNTARSNDFNLGLKYQLLPAIAVKGVFGITSAQAEENDFTQLLSDVSFHIKPLKLQTLDIGYKRQIESFNAALLDEELVQNNYYVNYNIASNIKLGWFTQYMFTSQNDGNQRQLLFTSLYYNLLKKPNLKVGVNYQHISFKEQVPTIYFSPKQFNAGELFFNLIKDETTAKPKSWFYELTAATGLQVIEKGDQQSTYRFQGALGYKFSKRSALNLYGTHSNIASATAAGFKYTEIGLRFHWQLFNSPIFRR